MFGCCSVEPGLDPSSASAGGKCLPGRFWTKPQHALNLQAAISCECASSVHEKLHDKYAADETQYQKERRDKKDEHMCLKLYIHAWNGVYRGSTWLVSGIWYLLWCNKWNTSNVVARMGWAPELRAGCDRAEAPDPPELWHTQHFKISLTSDDDEWRVWSQN